MVSEKNGKTSPVNFSPTPRGVKFEAPRVRGPLRSLPHSTSRRWRSWPFFGPIFFQGKVRQVKISRHVKSPKKYFLFDHVWKSSWTRSELKLPEHLFWFQFFRYSESTHHVTAEFLLPGTQVSKTVSGTKTESKINLGSARQRSSPPSTFDIFWHGVTMSSG